MPGPGPVSARLRRVTVPAYRAAVGRTQLVGGLVVACVLAVAACAVEDDPPLRTADQRVDERVDRPVTTTTPAARDAPRPAPGGPPTTDRARGRRVIRVVDGDTLDVAVVGREERVRLLGINAPEADECLGGRATTALEGLVAGRRVRLERDETDRDDYGRLLRHVFVDEVHVNRVLVERGLALARVTEPDTDHAGRLAAAGASARRAGRGLWATDACGRRAPGDVRIVAIEPDAPGDDNTNPNGEWVEVANRGRRAVDLTGWGLKDESASHRYAFPRGFTLRPGARVRVATGCGRDGRALLHWCEQGSAVWNNSGDTAFLTDPAGNVVDTRSYG